MKELKQFDGDLQSFADKVFATKKACNEVKVLGIIDVAVVCDMQSMGKEMQSDQILITDKKMLKYLNHPKASKGAVIDQKRYSEVEKMIKNPKAIYRDITTSEILYVYSSEYSSGTVIKVIIHPNYLLKGNFCNLLKSIGIITANKLNNNKQYIRIK